MDGSGAITETIEGLTLRELSGLGLAFARNLQERALQTEDNHEAAHLAEAFAKVGRGVRQTIALKMKLIRDEQAFFRDFKPFLDQQRQEAVAKKRRQLHDTVRDHLWTEYEDGEDEDLEGDLHDELDRLAGRDDFLDVPIHRHIDDLKAMFAAEAASDEDKDEDDPVPEEPPKPVRWGGPPDDPFILGEVTVLGMGPKPDSS